MNDPISQMGNEHSIKDEGGNVEYASVNTCSDNTLFSEEDNTVSTPSKTFSVNLFNGIWSTVTTEGAKPTPRIDNAFAYDYKTNLLYIFYGANYSGKGLNDAWILDTNTMKWRLIIEKMRGTRSGASAAILDDYIYIFGGKNGPVDIADFHRVNINTYEIEELPNLPNGAFRPAIFTKDNCIMIFANDALYEFDTESLKWIGEEKSKHQTTNDQTYSTSPNRNQFVFNTKNGLLKFHEKEFVDIKLDGPAPPKELKNVAMACDDEYLFISGGNHPSRHSKLYAFDLTDNKWITFFVLPDEVTTLYEDGGINDCGHFLLPRVTNESMFYSPKERSLMAVFGNLYLTGAPVQKIYIGEAKSILHLRHDMVKMIQEI